MANLTKTLATAVTATTNFGKTYAPEILAATGCASFVCANIATVLAQPKIEKMRKENNNLSEKNLTIKVLWHYIPTIGLIAVGTLCVGGSLYLKNKTIANLKQQVVTLGASAIASAEALKTYKKEIKKLVGESESQKIDESVAKSQKSKIESKDIPAAVVPKTLANAPMPFDASTNGLYLCVDGVSGQVFWSNVERINAVYQFVNLTINQDASCSINEYLSELGGGLHEMMDGDGRGWLPRHLNLVPRYSSCTIDTVPYTGYPALKVTPSSDPLSFEFDY